MSNSSNKRSTEKAKTPRNNTTKKAPRTKAKPKVKVLSERDKRIKRTYDKALQLIDKHKLFFIEDLTAMLGISKTTVYEYYPIDSDEMNTIKGLLLENRVSVKVGLRNKFYKSDNATANLALYKLVCTDEERKLLSVNYTELSGEVKTNNTVKRVFEIQRIERKRPSTEEDSQ